MKKDHIPLSPPPSARRGGSPGIVADGPRVPKKRPWSKPTILIVDDLVETGSAAQEQATETVVYRPFS